MSDQKYTQPGEAPRLRLGIEGAQVADLQRYLERYGYLKADALTAFNIPEGLAIAAQFQEGYFDESTREALAAFQQNLGLEITGEMDLPTQKLMELPRCGVPDVGEYVLDGRKWDRLDLTYGFQEYTPDLGPKDTRDAIRQALNLWGNVTPLRFSEIPLGGSPDIVIRFTSADHGDGSAFDGPGGILAHAFFPPPNGGALAGDVHFDEDESWTITPPPLGFSTVDLSTVAAHEFGHSLGLGHSNVSNALMYPYYGGPHRYLHADDITGIQRLYPALLARGWENSDRGGAVLDLNGGTQLTGWAVNRFSSFEVFVNGWVRLVGHRKFCRVMGRDKEERCFYNDADLMIKGPKYIPDLHSIRVRDGLNDWGDNSTSFRPCDPPTAGERDASYITILE